MQSGPLQAGHAWRCAERMRLGLLRHARLRCDWLGGGRRMNSRLLHAWWLRTGTLNTWLLHALPLQILLRSIWRCRIWLPSARLLASGRLSALLLTAWRQWCAAGLPGQTVRPWRCRVLSRLLRSRRRLGRCRAGRSLPVGRAGLLRLARPVLLARLPGAVGLTGLLLLRRGAVLSRHGVRLLRARLHRLAAVRIGLAGIGAAERALFVDHLTAEILRGVNLAHKTLVAGDLLR